MDLSSPHGSSINDYISKEGFTLHYATFDQAISVVPHHGIRDGSRIFQSGSSDPHVRSNWGPKHSGWVPKSW